jgi:hypothetical protein
MSEILFNSSLVWFWISVANQSFFLHHIQGSNPSGPLCLLDG